MQRITLNLVMIARAIMDEPDAEFYGRELLDELDFPGGVGYPVLNRLEHEGVLTSRWDHQGRPRRYYQLTRKGRDELVTLLDKARQDGRFKHLFQPA